MTDPLSATVSLIRPRAVLMTEIRGGGRWGIRFPDFNVTNFLIVAEGSCWIQVGSEAPVALREGDFLLQPKAGEFAFLSEPGVPKTYANAAYKHAAGDIIRLGDQAGPVTRVVGGFIAVEAVNTELFAALLPQVMHIPSGGNGAKRLANLLDLIADEARENNPGRDFMLQRLSEAMVVEVLRWSVSSDRLPPSGLIAGLRDRSLSAALHAMHADVVRPWRVETLAATAGMSRSAFIRHFHDVVGAAPMTYLAKWRMALAKAALLEGKRSLQEVAAEVGYGSAAALSHAFTRTVGLTPSAFLAARRR